MSALREQSTKGRWMKDEYRFSRTRSILLFFAKLTFLLQYVQLHSRSHSSSNIPCADTMHTDATLTIVRRRPSGCQSYRLWSDEIWHFSAAIGSRTLTILSVFAYVISHTFNIRWHFLNRISFIVDQRLEQVNWKEITITNSFLVSSTTLKRASPCTLSHTNIYCRSTDWQSHLQLCATRATTAKSVSFICVLYSLFVLLSTHSRALPVLASLYLLAICFY